MVVGLDQVQSDGGSADAGATASSTAMGSSSGLGPTIVFVADADEAAEAPWQMHAAISQSISLSEMKHWNSAVQVSERTAAVA